jgi:hypothetical protein
MARGDHLYVYCGGFSHHGIDIGDGQVVHFDSTPWRKLLGLDTAGRPAMIKCVSVEEFAHHRDIFVRDYNPDSVPEVVATRACSRIGERGYHLFQNNCEHFAVWCKTGLSDSTQVRAFLDATRPLVVQLPAAAALIRAGRYLPPRLRLAAYGTAISLTAGATAVRYLANRLDNFFAGES